MEFTIGHPEESTRWEKKMEVHGIKVNYRIKLVNSSGTFLLAGHGDDKDGWTFRI